MSDNPYDDISGPGYVAVPVGPHTAFLTQMLDQLLGDKMAILDVPAMSLAGSDQVFMLVEVGEETDTDFEYKHVPVLVTEEDGHQVPLMVIGMQAALMMLAVYKDQLTHPQGYLLMALQPKFAILHPLDALTQIHDQVHRMEARQGNGDA